MRAGVQLPILLLLATATTPAGATSADAADGAVVFEKRGQDQCHLVGSTADHDRISLTVQMDSADNVPALRVDVEMSMRSAMTLKQETPAGLFGDHVDRLRYDGTASPGAQGMMFAPTIPDFDHFELEFLTAHQVLWQLRKLASGPAKVAIGTETEEWIALDTAGADATLKNFVSCAYEVTGYDADDVPERDARIESRSNFERNLDPWAHALGHAASCSFDSRREDEIGSLFDQAGAAFYPNGAFSFLTGNAARDHWVSLESAKARLDFSIGQLQALQNGTLCLVADGVERGYRDILDSYVDMAGH